VQEASTDSIADEQLSDSITEDQIGSVPDLDMSCTSSSADVMDVVSKLIILLLYNFHMLHS